MFSLLLWQQVHIIITPLFICAQVISSRAQGKALCKSLLHMDADYHIYWRHGQMKRETRCFHLESIRLFHTFVSIPRV